MNKRVYNMLGIVGIFICAHVNAAHPLWAVLITVVLVTCLALHNADTIDNVRSTT